MRRFFSGTKRQVRGLRVGLVGLFLNLVLFGLKIMVGLLSGSIAVVVDSLNNLLDSASSVVTIVGFKVAGRKGDRSHPHGHGRVEYVAAFVIALIIIVTAGLLGWASVERIFAPVAVETSAVAIIVVGLAIVIKGLMAVFYLAENREIESQMLAASGHDALADMLSTGVSLVALCVSPLTSFPVDGVVGVLIAVFIFVLGARTFWANLHLLIGHRPDRAMLREVRRIVLLAEAFSKVLKLDIHDYGPENREILVKVRLKAGVSKYVVERDIEKARTELMRLYGAAVVIYWAPR